MSGPIAERSSIKVTPSPLDLRMPRPQTSMARTPVMGADEVAISKGASEAEASEADRILDLAIRPALEKSPESREVFVPGTFPPAPTKAPLAIQRLRFADNFDNGKESELTFERYPGDLTPPPQPPLFITRDPRTGATDLELKELRARVSGGDYDIYLKVGGDGSIGIDRIMKGGRNITSIAKDALVEKIKEDPAIYGTLTAVALAGAVAAARQHARKSGEGIEFDALSYKVVERDNFSVKTKLKAELTGDSDWVRASSAEVAARYKDERLEAYASAKYRVRESEWEAAVGANYQIDKNVYMTTGAFYRTQSRDYGAFVGLSATF